MIAFKYPKKISNDLTALCCVILCMAGPIRFILDIDRWIYFACIGVFLLLIVLKLMCAFTIQRIAVVHVLICLLLFSWLIFSVTWTASVERWQLDLQLLAGLAIILTSLVLLANHSVIKKFLTYLVISGIFVGFYILIEQGVRLGGITGHDTDVNKAYLTLSFFIAMAFITSVIYSIYAKRLKLFWIVAVVVLMLALSFSLGRAPLIFSIAVLLLLTIIDFTYNPSSLVTKLKDLIRRYLLVVIPVVVGLLCFALQVDRTAARLARMLMTPHKELLDGGRGILWVNAWEAISFAPFWGHGLGSSGLVSGFSEHVYPHNFFLQAWLDGGIVALFLTFLVIMLPLFLIFMKIRCNIFDPCLLSLFCVYSFLILQFSGSFNFYTARPLFIVGTLAVVYASNLQNKKIKKDVLYGGY